MIETRRLKNVIIFIQTIIEKHFKNNFQKDNANPIVKFVTAPKRLNNITTAKEVTKALQKLANNKAPGKDNINVELIKYAPEEVDQEISKVLNGIFETTHAEVKLGTGVLLPLSKLKKTQGPVKNPLPITLLEVIRKIISKIFMNRSEDKINRYLAKSQSAYRKSGSTTNIIWAHRWIIVKTQDIIIHVTSINMSKAFDTN